MGKSIMKTHRSTRLLRRRLPLAASIVTLLASHIAYSASQTWNISGPSNNWNTTETNWDSGALWIQGSDAIFTGTGETVALTAAITAGSLTFNSTGFTVSGNTITLAGAPSTITVTNSADSATISSILAGTAGLTKTGNGALTLSGANTFTGQLIISAGTVKANSAAALGATGAGNETVVQSGATLDINGIALSTGEIVQIAGTGVGGNGALINTGAAQNNALSQVVLTADATVGGTARFDVRTGTPLLDLAGFTLTKVGTGEFHVVGGTISNGNIAINAGIFSIETTALVQGTGTITIGSAGTLGLYQNTAGNLTRNIVSNGGTISNVAAVATSAVINSNITLNSGTTNIAASTTLTTTTFGGVISGTGNLSKNNGDIVILTGLNTYTGSTTIRGSGSSSVAATGYVQVSSIGNGGVAGNLGAASNAASNLIFGQSGSTAGQLNYVGTGESTDRLFTINGHAVIVNNGTGALIFSNTGAIIHATNSNVGHFLTLGGSNTGANTIASAISDGAAGTGAISVNKTDAGSWTLSGANTYTGTTTINAGTLTLDYSVSDSNKLSDTSALVLNGGTLNLTGGTYTDNAGSTTITATTAATITRTSGAAKVGLGAITRGAGATLTLGGSSIATTTLAPVSGNLGSWLTIGGTSLATTDGSNTIVAVTYTDVPTGGTIPIGAANEVRITGAAGTVALAGLPGTVTDAATLTRTDAGVATIDTTGKTLRLGARGAILSGTGGGGLTIGTIASAGVLTAGGADNTAGLLDVNTIAGNVIIHSAITNNGTGAVNLSKIGANELWLDGANTYSGGTTLEGGVIRVGSNSALGTGTVSILGSAQLAGYTGTNFVTVGNTINIATGVNLTVSTAAATMVFSGPITGAGNYTNGTTSGGTRIFTGTNTYTGTTTVNIGSLMLQGSGTINNTSSVTVGSAQLYTNSFNSIGAGGSSITMTSGSAGSGVFYTGAGETTTRILNYSTAAGGIFTNNGTGTLIFSNNFTMANSAMGLFFQGGGTTSIQGITGNTSALLNFNKAGVGTLIVNGTITPNLGNIRAQGGLLSFASTATTVGNAIFAGQRVVGGVVQFASGSSIKTADANTSGIMGGWATYNGTDWAQTNGSNNAISAYTGTYASDTWAAGSNTTVTTSSSPASASTTNSLRFNAAAANMITLTGINTITSGGILVTNNVGANLTTITGGTLIGAASADLVINQFNTGGGLTINSIIANNVGATGLTLVGPGTITLGGVNTYTGATAIIGNATVQANTSTAFSTSTVNVAAGATLRTNVSTTIGGTGQLTGLTLSGGTLAINTGTIFQTDNNGTGNITIAGSNTTITSYGGTATLRGVSIANGNLVVNTGVTGASIASSVNLDTNTAGLRINANVGSDLTINGIISGAGNSALTAQSTNAAAIGTDAVAFLIRAPGGNTTGGGTVILTAANTFTAGTGKTAVTSVEGTLKLTGGANRLPAASAVYLGSTANTGGTLVLDGVSQTLAGLQSVGTGPSAIVGSSATLSTLTVNNVNDYTFAGTIGGVFANQNNLAFVKGGTGTMTFSGFNTYTGTTTINAGRLILTGALSSASTVSVASGATLGGSGSVGATTVASGGLLEAGVGGNGTLTLSGLTFAGTSAVTIGTPANYLSTAAINVTGTLTLSGGAGSVTLNLNTAAVVSGTYHLIAHGNTLADISAFTIGTAPTLGARQSGTLVNNTGYIDYVVSGDTPKWTGALSSEWSTNTLASPKNWKLISGGTATDYLTGDSVFFDDSAASKVVNISVADVTPASIQFSNSLGNDYTLTGAFGITGATPLVKSGAGTLNINTPNSYSGVTNLTGGAIRVNNATALGSGQVTVTGSATLGTTVGGAATALANAISVAASNTLTLDSTNATLTLNGAFTGGGSLATTGSGTTILAGANTYTGTTSIAAGTTLQIGNGGPTGALGTGTTTIASGATLIFNLSGPLTLSTLLTGAGAIVKNGTGNLTMTTVATSTGGLTINAGTVTLGGAGLAFDNTGGYGGGAVVVNAGGTLAVGTTFALGYSRSITVNGGTLTNNNFDVYQNNLTLQNGAQMTGGAFRMGYHSQPTLTVSGTSASTISSQLNLVKNGTTASNLTVNVNDVNGTSATDLLVSGAVIDLGGFSGLTLTKTGAGTMVLAATNTYAGGTIVNQGKLIVSGGITGATTVNSGGTLAVNGSINGTGSVTTVKSGGVLMGSNLQTANAQITGSVSVESGGTLVAGDGITAANGLVINGNLSLASGSQIKLTLGGDEITHSILYRSGGTWTFDPNQSFSIVDAGLVTGMLYEDVMLGFDELSAPNTAGWTIAGGNYSGVFTYDGAGGVDLMLTAVPEPSTFATLFGSVGLFTGLLRFRRRTDFQQARRASFF